MPASLKELQEKCRWLLRKASNVTSQYGEDGIISAALDLLPERNGWCIEFGAWDGRNCSNTYDLVKSRGYRGVFIEPDPARFRELQQNHDATRNILLNGFVGFDETDCLDALLREHVSIPREVDVLSIDIDGNDYHVWTAIHSFQPKLVIIEYNPTIANAVHFVQERRRSLNQGSSAAALVDLGRSKGYELVAATLINLVFVQYRYYPLFGIPDNSLEVMRDDSKVPHIFVGYDGKVFLSELDTLGSISLPWHGMRLSQSSVQCLPRRLQKYPNNYSRMDKFVFRYYFEPWQLKGRPRYYLGTLRRVLRSVFQRQPDSPKQ
jgi:hypothetical protein